MYRLRIRSNAYPPIQISQADGPGAWNALDGILPHSQAAHHDACITKSMLCCTSKCCEMRVLKQADAERKVESFCLSWVRKACLSKRNGTRSSMSFRCLPGGRCEIECSNSSLVCVSPTGTVSCWRSLALGAAASKRDPPLTASPCSAPSLIGLKAGRDSPG